MSISICSYEDCLGCGLCESICPKSAISIQIINGFFRPVISNDCISCGLCKKKCLLYSKPFLLYSPKSVFASWSHDDSNHFKSSSGGLAYTISYHFILKGGAVVGVWFNPASGKVEHRIFEDQNDLYLMRGSKYVQSLKHNKIFKKVIEKLRDKDVLFIGMPCEVYAMQHCISKTKTKHQIYYIDLICHGGSSPECLYNHLSLITNNIQNISFRGGDQNWKLCVYKTNNKLVYSEWNTIDPYFSQFMKHTIYQNACYSCMFAGIKRTGDLTLGDFWGIASEVKRLSPPGGINILLINSGRGQDLIDLVKNEIELIARPIEEAIGCNETLRNPTQKPDDYEELWQLINLQGFHKAIKMLYGIRSKRIILLNRVKQIASRIRKILSRIS